MYGLLFAVLTIVGVSSISTIAVSIWNDTPSVDQLINEPIQNSTVYAADGETILFTFFKEEKREIVTLSADPQKNQIPEIMQLAILAIEDENFYKNVDGVPWKNIAGATGKCIKIILVGSSDENCRGGSGISQQLVKNLTGDKRMSVNRKIQKQFKSVKLNKHKNQQEILELYLNTVPFGRNAYGVQEASKTYFGHPIYQKDDKNNFVLTPTKACYLASFVQQPTYFTSATGIDGGNGELSLKKRQELDDRKDFCLKKLHEKRIYGDSIPPYIKTKAELEKYKSQEIAFESKEINYKYPHFIEFIEKELISKKIVTKQNLQTKGLKIVTTLDPKLQDEIQTIMDENKDRYVFGKGANNASAVILDGPTGEIKAMIGSLDYKNEDIDGKVNIATSPQQPGSSIKPYVYASAFNNGFNPGTVLLDVETTFTGNFKPKNFSGTFSGPRTIRSSLQNSLNIPAVKAVFLSSKESIRPDSDSGVNNFLDFTQRTGVDFPCIPGASNQLFENKIEKCTLKDQQLQGISSSRAHRGRCFLASAIGGCELTMVSHATGMNTFAQEGNLFSATPFKEVSYQKDGEKIDLYKIAQSKDNPPYPVIKERINPLVARQITNVLSDYRSRNFGSANKFLELPRWRVAAKTGTSNNGKTGKAVDAWTVGYSPYYTTVVWVGNTDNSHINSTGISTAAPIWNKIMAKLHENKEVKEFSKEGLKAIRLDPATGLISSNGLVEWLSDEQIKKLRTGNYQISSSNLKDSPATKKSIFQNRSSVANYKLKINTLDNKLAVEGVTPEFLVSEIDCTNYISAFPVEERWFRPAQNYTKNALLSCPEEESTIENDNFSMEIITNLKSNSTLPSILKASARLEGLPEDVELEISKIDLYINENLFRSSETSSISISKQEILKTFSQAKILAIKIVASDSFGKTIERNYDRITLELVKPEPGLELDLEPLPPEELAKLKASCTRVEAGQQTSCSFIVPEGKTLLGNYKIFVGSSASGGLCNVNKQKGFCSKVPTELNDSGKSLPIKIGKTSEQSIQVGTLMLISP